MTIQRLLAVVAVLSAPAVALASDAVSPGPCSDLTQEEASALETVIGGIVICPVGYVDPAEPLLAKGRPLLPCLEDVFLHGYDAKGLPAMERQSTASRYYLHPVIDRIAPERALKLARGAFLEDQDWPVFYDYLLAHGERELVVPRLKEAMERKQGSLGARARVAWRLGTLHDRSLVPFLEEHLEDFPASGLEARQQVEIAILELKGDAQELAAKTWKRGWSSGATLALLRLGREDIVERLAADEAHPHRKQIGGLLRGAAVLAQAGGTR